MDRLIELYQEHFVPAYSDLTGYVAKKPEEILLEVEHTFSHLMQYLNEDLDPVDRETNIR